MKRLFDLIISVLFITLALPIWFLIAIVIKIDSSGSVFYKGLRVGKDGKKFYIFKFRTMIEGADKKGPPITIDRDYRITGIGRILRKLKLDEMPQLFNVIKGEMSIVGPRPEHPKYVQYYSKKQLQVLSILPGMASPAFIKYRREEEILAQSDLDKVGEVYINRILPEKLEMDLEYLDNRSFMYDIKILINAALSLLR